MTIGVKAVPSHPPAQKVAVMHLKFDKIDEEEEEEGDTYLGTTPVG